MRVYAVCTLQAAQVAHGMRPCDGLSQGWSPPSGAYCGANALRSESFEEPRRPGTGYALGCVLSYASK